MQISLQELAKMYSSVQDRLRSPLELAERNRRQLEIFREDLRRQITAALRARMKALDRRQSVQ
jgi:hypothetical protein